MIGRLLFSLAALALAQAASAQSDDWVLAQRDKDAIGIVEVRIGSAGLPADDVTPVERGTGAIISGAGHVLTAGHIFSPETYAICSKAVDSDASKSCKISFLWRGDRANRFELTIAFRACPPNSSTPVYFADDPEMDVMGGN